MADTADMAGTITSLLDSRRSDVVLTWSGEVDYATMDELVDEFCRWLHPSAAISRLTIDLANVTFLDSMGLCALLRARVLCRNLGVRFVLRDVPPPVTNILVTTGLDETFEIESVAGRGFM